MICSGHSWNGSASGSVMTTMPNPITGRGLPTKPMGLVIEIMQAAFIDLGAAIIVYEASRKKLDRQTAAEAA